jgi:hypothetical protein
MKPLPLSWKRWGDPEGYTVRSTGTKVWTKNGLYHRLTSPALITPFQYEYWAYKGLWHRLKEAASYSPGGHDRMYCLYGNSAKDEEQFKNKSWRRDKMLKQVAQD